MELENWQLIAADFVVLNSILKFQKFKSSNEDGGEIKGFCFKKLFEKNQLF